MFKPLSRFFIRSKSPFVNMKPHIRFLIRLVITVQTLNTYFNEILIKDIAVSFTGMSELCRASDKICIRLKIP